MLETKRTTQNENIKNETLHRNNEHLLSGHATFCPTTLGVVQSAKGAIQTKCEKFFHCHRLSSFRNRCMESLSIKNPGPTRLLSHHRCCIVSGSSGQSFHVRIYPHGSAGGSWRCGISGVAAGIEAAPPVESGTSPSTGGADAGSSWRKCSAACISSRASSNMWRVSWCK